MSDLSSINLFKFNSHAAGKQPAEKMEFFTKVGQEYPLPPEIAAERAKIDVMIQALEEDKRALLERALLQKQSAST